MSMVQYLKYQLEDAGGDGGLHWQGVVRFRAMKTLAQAKLAIGGEAHLEVARAWAAAKAYVEKEETKVEGPWEVGQDLGVGRPKRIDMSAILEAAKAGKRPREIIDEHGECLIFRVRQLESLCKVMRPAPPISREVLVYYIWGATGVGKTHWPMTFHGGGIWKWSGQTKWFQGYDGQEAVLFDDVGPSNVGEINQWKQLLDKWPMEVEYKGGSCPWSPTRIYMTSQRAWQDLWPGASVRAEDLAAIARRITQSFWVTTQDEMEAAAVEMGLKD